MSLRKSIALCSLCLVGAGAVAVATAVTSAEPAPPKAEPSTQPVNKQCAVMPEDAVDPKVTVVYKGQTIGFCCKDCIPTFEKNPEKYVKNMK